MKYLLIFIILFIIIFIPGCSLFSSYDEVIVTLPGPPGHWTDRFSSLWFSICYLDIDGIRREKILLPGETECILALPKIRNWPVVALCRGDSFILCPAGGFYGLDMSCAAEPVLTLTWKHGFAASLLQDCTKEGFDIARFNVARFAREALKRSNRDPWNLDSGLIMEKLLSGNFRVANIKTRPTTGMSLHLAEGEWFFSSPFSPVKEVRTPGIVCFEQVPLGFDRLFHVNSHKWYELNVTEQETIIVSYEKRMASMESSMPANPLP